MSRTWACSDVNRACPGPDRRQSPAQQVLAWAVGLELARNHAAAALAAQPAPAPLPCPPPAPCAAPPAQLDKSCGPLQGTVRYRLEECQPRALYSLPVDGVHGDSPHLLSIC